MKALLALAAALLLAGCSAPAKPDGTVVHAVAGTAHGEHFEPADVTVHRGDAVTFRIDSGSHTVDFEQTNGVSSPHQEALAPGTSVRVAFNETGTFHYYCQYHLPGMVGTVTVE